MKKHEWKIQGSKNEKLHSVKMVREKKITTIVISYFIYMKKKVTLTGIQTLDCMSSPTPFDLPSQ